MRTPAGTVLAMNTGNRRVNRRKLQQLVDQMRSGKFENTGEPVIVSVEGVVNNGQHRLMAVVEADAVLDMDVRFGIPRKAFSKTDTGAPRTGADVLSIKGVQAGIAGGVDGSAVDPLRARAAGGDPRLRQQRRGVARLRSLAGRRAGGGRGEQARLPEGGTEPPFYATAFLASRTPQKGKLERWLDAVATGLDVARDHPAYQLRERLMRGVDPPVGTREGQLERFALMIKSWNLRAKGETVTMREFRWTGTGRNAEQFPGIAGAKLQA